MMGEKLDVAIKLASKDCGNGYDADDLEVLAAFFTIAGKAVRSGVHGMVYCCEPESRRENKMLAEIKVTSPLHALRTVSPQHIGRVALNVRNFVYRIEQKEDFHFSCSTCPVTTCPTHFTAQAGAYETVADGSEALPVQLPSR